MAQKLWLYVIFAYIFIASITPVWILLQPRDYLSSFLLIGMILCAFAGIIISNPTIHITPFAGFEVNGNYLFPMLFVTVACGAVSGFHTLAASGTASKQINNERDMLPVSFGAMLLESLLAVIALIAVGAIAVGGIMPKDVPPVIFANALSGFLTGMGLPYNITFTLITLSISAFALTTLDSAARIGRLSFQEFFVSDEKPSFLIRILSNKYLATTATLLLAYCLALHGYRNIWPLFGSANQLLAALTLIACAVFLKRTKRSGLMLYIPFGFMLAVTFSALGISIFKLLAKLPKGFDMASDGMQLFFAILLLALGIVVAIRGIGALRGQGKECKTEPVA
jgi:carbon starvation protein